MSAGNRAVSTPAAAADHHAAYLARLLAIGIEKPDALAMTVAFIQADAMRMAMGETPEPPPEGDDWKR